MDDHDAIIIGTGQSGPSLARRLVAADQKVAVIERKFFGGTCVNTGCTPTKTLVASAYAAYLARRAGDYGVTIGGPVGVDMKAVKARKDAVAGASRRGVERSLKTLEGCTVYEGHAQFVGTKKGGSGRCRAQCRSHLHQCGRAGIDPSDPRPGPGSLTSPTAR
jgi:pyruvate/2-oxoglutarate dehydrogenase complex dihydrolipoamide dehydrogenase (E3) component